MTPNRRTATRVAKTTVYVHFPCTMAQHNNAKSGVCRPVCPVIVALIVVQSPKPTPKPNPDPNSKAGARNPKNPTRKAVTNQPKLRQKGWNDRRLLRQCRPQINLQRKLQNWKLCCNYSILTFFPLTQIYGAVHQHQLITHTHTHAHIYWRTYIFNARVEGASLWTLLG